MISSRWGLRISDPLIAQVRLGALPAAEAMKVNL
jgi:hypothetical protein